MHSKILLTGFCNTSAETLLKTMHGFRTLLLPNDRVKDAEILMEALSEERFDLVISIGQRPNIKNKVHIETTARDGENRIVTNFDYNSFLRVLEENGIPAKLSHNAGTSYCNHLYANGLRFLFRNGWDTEMVFVHIPFEKNIADFADFRKRFFAAVTYLQR